MIFIPTNFSKINNRKYIFLKKLDKWTTRDDAHQFIRTKDIKSCTTRSPSSAFMIRMTVDLFFCFFNSISFFKPCKMDWMHTKTQINLLYTYIYINIYNIHVYIFTPYYKFECESVHIYERGRFLLSFVIIAS